MEKLEEFLKSLSKEENQKLRISLRESENNNTISNKADFVYKFLFNYLYDIS